MYARARDLFRLIRKNVDWVWTQELTDRVNEFKLELSQRPLLSIFNQDYETFLYTDASPFGVGAVLAQKQPEDGEKDPPRPVYYISKSFVGAETNYSQIEKEGLGIKWGVTPLIGIHTIKSLL